MLKGTSRQIVEIVNTENPYFERAFFIVRPTCTDFSSSRLDKEAGRLLHEQSPYTGMKRTRQKWLLERVALLLLGGGVGVGLSYLIGILA